MAFFTFWSKKLTALLCALLICTPLATARSAKRHTSHTGSVQHVKSTTRTKARASTAKSKSKTTEGKRKSKKATRRAPKPRGQQAIESDRVREIQEALIREKYMDGEPSGFWDDTTKQALMKFQGDNGWQTKIVPDSRALIKLGLGPDHSKAINRPYIESSSAITERPGGGSSRQ